LSIDRTFLIDLQRERAAGDDNGAAHRFLQRSPDAELFLSTIALGEFVEGLATAGRILSASERKCVLVSSLVA
jgi:tRNA(fMet)-specific endonuclease VapC